MPSLSPFSKGLFVAAALLTSSAFADSVGQVKMLSGDVSLQRGDQVSSVALGDAIQPADVLKTSTNGSVGVLLQDDSRFALGPDSEFEVASYSYDASRSTGDAELNIRSGTLSVIAGRMIDTQPESLRVRTPTAVIAVRGTEFAVKVDKANK